MKSAFVFASALILLMVVSTVPVSAAENEYGIVNATFNGQDASTKIIQGVKLKIGEPVEIRVIVTSKMIPGPYGARVYLSLENPLVTVPYDVIEGTAIDKSIYNMDVPENWTKTFIWRIKPNDKWTNGNAPINIYVSFSNPTKYGSDQKLIEFTIANPIILNEQYSGAAATPQTSGATETPKTDASQNTTPFPYLYLVLIGAAVIVVIVLFKMRKK